MKPYIANPCHEDWNQMLPEEQGRFCRMCSKTVVDFIDWEPEVISEYLIQHKDEKICGRFSVHQLYAPAQTEEPNWPALIGVSALSYIRKVAAVIIVVFGLGASSCNTDVQGKAVASPAIEDTSLLVPSDIVESESVSMGSVIVPAPAECDKGLHVAKPLVNSRAEEVVGDTVGVIIGSLPEEQERYQKGRIDSDTTSL